MRTLLALAAVAAAAPARGAVVVLANYTPADVTYTVAEPGGKPRKLTLPAFHVTPVAVSGPADLVAPAGGKNPAVRVDPYHVYVLVPDPDAGVRVEGLELPGKMPDRDAKPEPDPRPRPPVKIPVTLLVDDADPRTEKGWREAVRRRFDAAAAVLESQTGFRLEFAGFGTWKSDRAGKDADAQLVAFEKAVAVKPGALAVGFLSREIDNADGAPFGACKGFGTTHVLVREWRPRGEAERVEVLLRYVAASLGAVPSPDTGSVMRPRLGDGQALNGRFVVRLDPLNTLALNLWADARRDGITGPAGLAPADRVRLLRVYGAMALASPDDAHAAEYVRELERDPAGRANPGGAKKEPAVPVERLRRADAARAVVRAVTDRAKANTGPAALTGDALTAELVRAAAAAVLPIDEQDQAAVFLVGLGVALDDGTGLRDHPATAAAVKEVETDAERAGRLAVLGNPTLRNRRDLCRRFAAGCAAGGLLAAEDAEKVAVDGAVAAAGRPSGLGFPGLAAEFAGVALARKLRAEPALLGRVREQFSAADLVPDPAGLRDGIGAEKFGDEYGGPGDARFGAVLDEIRKRVAALPVNRRRVD